MIRIQRCIIHPVSTKNQPYKNPTLKSKCSLGGTEVSWHHISLGFNRNFRESFVLDSAFKYEPSGMLNVAFGEETRP